MRLLSTWVGYGCICFCFCAGAAGQGLTRADRPDVKVGDTWRYYNIGQNSEKRLGEEIIVREVTSSEIVLTAGKSVQRFTRDWNLIESKSGDAVTVSNSPHRLLYAFPMEVGKDWSGRWQLTSPRFQEPTNWNATVKVVGVETVTVPAGTFETIKLEFTGHYHRSNNNYVDVRGARNETVWYSPSVKRAVKGEWTETSPQRDYRNNEKYELASFKLAP